MIKKIKLSLTVCLLIANILHGQVAPKIFPGADEKTPSRSEYFSWINNINEGTTTRQSLKNLEFFKGLSAQSRPGDIFVNCGGTATDGATNDQVWPWPEDSWGYVGKTLALSTNIDIANNYGLPNAMKSARVWNNDQEYTRSNEFYYKFTLDNGIYQVKLYFAEIENIALNQRKFDVYLNDDMVLCDYDIRSDAGGRDRGVEKVFSVSVTEQKLEIRFVKGINKPMINALRITKTAEQLTPLARDTIVTVPGNHPRIHYVRWNKFAGTCSMEFVGTSIKWSGPRGSDMGKVDVFIDGVFQTTVDQYSPTCQVNQTIFEMTGLSDNRHVFGILKAGEKNASANGDLVTIQSLTYTQGTNSTPAKVVYTDIRPHRPFWLDTDGNRIKAHLGNVQYFDGTYYWYGEDPGNTPLPAGTIGGSYPWSYNQGVAIYSSKDFYNWTYRGNVLQATSDKKSPLSVPSRMVGPNPVVVKNDLTGKYVMYAELVDPTFVYNNILVAVADHPAGPFRFLNAGLGGNDMTAFKDDDGKAYHWVRGTVRELTDDYLHFREGIVVGGTKDGGIEGGGVWKYNGSYYRSFSYTRGMWPSPTTYYRSQSPLGIYDSLGNLCQGPLSADSFQTQVFHIMKVPNKKNAYVYMGWVNEWTQESNMAWLPMRIHKDGTFEVNWVKQWDLSWFDTHPQPEEP